MIMQVFRHNLVFMFLALFFPTKNICENSSEKAHFAENVAVEGQDQNEEKGLFWPDSPNTQTLDPKLMMQLFNNILTLVNESISLKITSDVFKLTLTELGEQVDKINMDLDAKTKLQAKIKFLVNQLPKFSNKNQKDIIMLTKLVDQLSSHE